MTPIKSYCLIALSVAASSLFGGVICRAETYFVSGATGDDSRSRFDAQAIETPWRKHYYSLGATGGQSDVNHYTVGGIIDGTAGVYFNGDNNTLTNSVVMHGWGSLVTLLGSNSTIANNHCTMDCRFNWRDAEVRR